MVEKKAPHLVLATFARVLRECPDARLHFIGDGALLGVCRDLAAALGIDHAVTFLGAQPHDIVEREMRQARALVQHSVIASNGDSEGTPVAILEAGAMGLPVVATRHAGIPDVVADGVTGFLVEERDVCGMATHMLALARNPASRASAGATPPLTCGAPTRWSRASAGSRASWTRPPTGSPWPRFVRRSNASCLAAAALDAPGHDERARRDRPAARHAVRAAR